MASASVHSASTFFPESKYWRTDAASGQRLPVSLVNLRPTNSRAPWPVGPGPSCFSICNDLIRVHDHIVSSSPWRCFLDGLVSSGWQYGTISTATACVEFGDCYGELGRTDGTLQYSRRYLSTRYLSTYEAIRRTCNYLPETMR